ncbi:MAG: FHA domain-containing protein [Oligosphaeraceae bacterium]|mgnify:CR=1 FL=1|nr:FHA domain-containing protein [Oligosphaeraceae bacterium]
MPICHIYDSSGTQLVRFNTEAYAQGGRISIGRSSSCSISLKGFAQPYVSREHFVLDKRGSVWHILDRSHIGIVKDAVRVKSAPLEEGDIYRFGQLFFCYGATARPSDYDLCWEPDGRAALWPGVNSLGASTDNYVSIRQGEVSRFHALLKVKGESLVFENSNRNIVSFLDGKRLDATPIALNTRSNLVLGDVPVRLQKVSRHAADSVEMSQEDLSPDEVLALQAKKRKGKIPFALLCLLIFSFGFLAFLMIMLYILFL